MGIRSGLLCLCFAVLAACASDDGETPVCPDGTACETSGEVCSTATDRCTCASSQWACEPLACPVGDTVEGTPCTPEGLRCDTGFENPGSRCVGPELTWARCRYYHQASGGGPPNGCPGSAPTVGAPCCQGLGAGGPPLGCVYGAEVIDCVNDHWVRR